MKLTFEFVEGKANFSADAVDTEALASMWKANPALAAQFVQSGLQQVSQIASEFLQMQAAAVQAVADPGSPSPFTPEPEEDPDDE